ncbi:hypothetical protein ACFWBG_33685 [Nocardia salmonicida]|uniref:hypothetical protein n=1 Tax=Nocardia salmonicida TaxID=53431 RepID=UPI00366EF63A
MEIVVNRAGVKLVEPDNFTGFRVAFAGERRADLARALAPYGRLADDGNHAFISRRGVEALAGERATDAAWRTSLDEMIGYAVSRGWTDESGFIRAHIEAF